MASVIMSSNCNIIYNYFSWWGLTQVLTFRVVLFLTYFSHQRSLTHCIHFNWKLLGQIIGLSDSFESDQSVKSLHVDSSQKNTVLQMQLKVSSKLYTWQPLIWRIFIMFLSFFFLLFFSFFFEGLCSDKIILITRVDPEIRTVVL